jgi:cystathionine beta-lyase family protein involved in aluminum resistance
MINPGLARIASQAESCCGEEFRRLEVRRRRVFSRVLEGFHRAGVTETHLKGSSGYGLGDSGREMLESTFAWSMEGEDALVRPQFVSGTHVLACALRALTEPGKRLVCWYGPPYDSLFPTFAALARQGVVVEMERDPAGAIPPADLYFLQRSRGYRLAPGPSPEVLAGDLAMLKEMAPAAWILVDNCYGEFVQEREPTAFGADLLAGSLIKNPGGGLALSGGYVVGKRELVSQVADALFAPGLGKELGATEGALRSLFQGLFLAPSAVCEALKGAVFAAHFFTALGFQVSPEAGSERNDVVQAIQLGSAERLLAFARGIQQAGPVDAAAIPLPFPMPSYGGELILMAGGTFVSGATLELSCDAPMVPPYAIYLQGGLSYDHAYLGALQAAQILLEERLLP